MRNTPILIPIILAICIGTLAYLLFAAFNSSAGTQAPRVELPRVSDDYRVPDEPASPPEAPEYNEPTPSTYDRTAAPVFEEDEQVANTWDEEDNRVVEEITADNRGRWVVLAGSFRQLANAERQASKLRKAGFAETEIVKSTGGAYAMAQVGRRSDEREANRLMAEVKAKGFDARVVKR